MKYIYLIIINLIFNNTFSQNKVLKDFDLQNNEYTFYFFEKYNAQKNKGKEDIKKPFVIKNKQKLEQLKNSWIGDRGETDEPADCGYDYEIFIVENDSLVSKLNVNTECGQVIVFGKGTSYNFSPNNPFESLTKDSDVYTATFLSDTLPKSRKLYALLKNQKYIYYPLAKYDNWVDFDGEFYYSAESKNDSIDFKNRYKIVKDINDKFKNKNIFVNYSTLSTNSIGGYIYCSQSFYIELKDNIPVWDDFKFSISEFGYWKPWSEDRHRKKYYAYVFTDDEKKLDDLIIEAQMLDNSSKNQIHIKKRVYSN